MKATLLLSLLSTCSALAVTTAFDFSLYDFSGPATQDIVVGNINGKDCIVTITVNNGGSTASGGSDQINFSTIPNGNSATYDISLNWTSDIRVTSESQFQNASGTRQEGSNVSANGNITAAIYDIAAGDGALYAFSNNGTANVTGGFIGTGTSTTVRSEYVFTGSSFTYTYNSLSTGGAALTESSEFFYDLTAHVPEPSSAALLGLGGLALLARRRRS